MKKIVAILILILIIVVSMVFAKKNEIKKFKQNIEKINNEFLVYENKKIQVNTLVTLMNKAIEYNFNNKIEQDENGHFIENNSNSIKIFIEFPIENVTVSMEKLLLNKDKDDRNEKVENTFSESLFEMKKVEYHEKTKQIKSITFIELTN